MYTLDHRSCEDCTAKRSRRPPCIDIRMKPAPGLILIAADAIGWTCPFKASWAELVQYAKMIPHPGITSYAEAQLKVIQQQIDKQTQKPPRADMCYVLEGAKIDNNNNLTYVMPDGTRRLMTFLRRLPEHEWWNFWNEFQGGGFLTPVSNMSTEEKFGVAVDRAYNKLPGQYKAACKELINPMFAGMIIGVFVLMAATPAKMVVFVRNALLGLGLSAQLFGYTDDLAKFVVGASTASSYDDLDKSATALAHLLGTIGRDISLAVLIDFIAALKKGAGAWSHAARKAEDAGGAAKVESHPAAKPAEGAGAGAADASAHMIDSVSREAGMQRWHVKGWIKWAKQNRTLVVLRTCNKAGLPRHFDELVTGKVVDVKWKSAKGGPHDGLVVVPEAQGMHHQKLVEEILKLKKKGYRFMPPGKDGIPEAGALLIGPDGRAFCSDVDKMGIYVVDHAGKAKPHPDWAAYNDNPANRERLQREVYGGGPGMDQHGGQDFFTVGVDGSGHPVMGRQPELNETFLVVDPHGTPQVVNLSQLKLIYQQYGIRWPYKV